MRRGETGCCASAVLVRPNEPRQVAREMRASRARRRVNLSPRLAQNYQLRMIRSTTPMVLRSLVEMYWYQCGTARAVDSIEGPLWGCL